MSVRPGRGRKGTLKLIAFLRARDGDNCMFCHEPVDFTLEFGVGRGASIDHVRPKAARGGNGKDNLQILHTMPCQKTKGSWWEGVNYAAHDYKSARHEILARAYRSKTGDRAPGPLPGWGSGEERPGG